jgi:hypothetical protein
MTTSDTIPSTVINRRSVTQTPCWLLVKGYKGPLTWLARHHPRTKYLTLVQGEEGSIVERECLALCLLLRLGEYWFRISHYVYDRNRPLAPILRQWRCSLIYDVYLTCISRWWWTGTSHTMGSKYLEYNPGSELNIFLWSMNNEKQKKNKCRTKDEQNSNESRTTIK